VAWYYKRKVHQYDLEKLSGTWKPAAKELIIQKKTVFTQINAPDGECSKNTWEQHGYYHVYPAIVYNIEIEINAGM